MSEKKELKSGILEALSEKLKDSSAKPKKLKKAIKNASGKLAKKLAAFVEKRHRKASKKKSVSKVNLASDPKSGSESDNKRTGAKTKTKV
jgi:hypothetical protein